MLVPHRADHLDLAVLPVIACLYSWVRASRSSGSLPGSTSESRVLLVLRTAAGRGHEAAEEPRHRPSCCVRYRNPIPPRIASRGSPPCGRGSSRKAPASSRDELPSRARRRSRRPCRSDSPRGEERRVHAPGRAPCTCTTRSRGDVRSSPDDCGPRTAVRHLLTSGCTSPAVSSTPDITRSHSRRRQLQVFPWMSPSSFTYEGRFHEAGLAKKIRRIYRFPPLTLSSASIPRGRRRRQKTQPDGGRHLRESAVEDPTAAPSVMRAAELEAGFHSGCRYSRYDAADLARRSRWSRCRPPGRTRPHP